MNVTAVSAPGKVLIAGGYLVLDRGYTGMVFSLDARIHVLVQALPTTEGVTLSEIIVRSPQFKNAVWEYGYRLTEHNGGILINQLRLSSGQEIHKNPFVETALSHVLSYVSTYYPSLIHSISITILADDDYYSQSTPRAQPRHGSPNSNFSIFDLPMQQVHKTGLGSSAALVTALTAAMLDHYLRDTEFILESESGRQVVHNLAQMAHCAAQGKVGSGFDVAAAVYGSCTYRRFSPDLLESVRDPGKMMFALKVKELVEDSGPEKRFNAEITKTEVTVPQGLRLVMCDVDCGSKTPGMVKSVLQWRKDDPEDAENTWRELHSANEALAHELSGLQSRERRDYANLKSVFSKIRELMRYMSAKSGVPIEPPSQTKLLDACAETPGVVGGVVPGAGGYDAIALLIEDSDEVGERLRRFLESWKVEESSEQGQLGGKVRMLRVREESQGLRREDTAIYESYMS